MQIYLLSLDKYANQQRLIYYTAMFTNERNVEM